ncbi:nitroreductase family protein [Prauserella shujinwangii]|uniref:Nitroreductase family protein n=1 Tax=Prauserella shujinwangii TaxID=1453103 RepID=A0A2T0LPL6_9PSEU|nr:nitroreductase family protein [Prauserella shujinwangii]PRX45201.1 nitroreductase family protein [Prauserella shujinwangii]
MTGHPAPIPGVVDAALRAAIRAPSPHNTQPWRFRTGPDRIELWLDESRVLGVCDPDAREATLACGAALLNLRLALAAHERAHVVDLVPDHARPALLATVRLGGHRTPSPHELRLASAIGRRHTHRRPFLDRPVPGRVRDALVAAAAEEGARLVLVDSAQLDALTALLRRADLAQAEDPAFQAELRAWTPGDDRPDGVPRSAGGPRALDGGLLALRDYGGPRSGTEREFEREPLVAVLTTAGDTRLDRVRAGQAMQRVLLTATADGLNASFLSQPVEVGSARARLRDRLGGRDHPQTVLRLGYGHPGAPTPRRAVASVTRVERGERSDVR